MTQTIEQHDQALRIAFKGVHQEHVFAFWADLDPSQRRQLLDDLACVNIQALPELARLAATGQTAALPTETLRPVQVIPRKSVSADIVARGRALVAAGKAAAFTVAGGQGTRLGFDGPKGAFQISPVRNKPLFQLFAESILGTDRRYGCRTQWYIMTSPANDSATRAFFQQHAHFGMQPDSVMFFQQGVMPAFDHNGKILLDDKHRLALAPDGHGGSLLALARTGMLADMAQRGIDYISYFQVDNPLVMCIDPVFVGLHAASGAEMSSKALPKADDLERVGNFAMAGMKQVVIEYSDLPNELAHARNADGTRTFDAGSIAIHLLSRAFVERLTSDAASFALPWHKAKKKVPYVDLATGRRVEPDEPNAIKLESFVFDALPLAKNPVVMGTSREEEFSPVKNATGVDSVETARRDMNRRAARWLESAGFKVPRNSAGEPDAVFEISPLLAVDAGQVRERGVAQRTFNRGAEIYLE